MDLLTGRRLLRLLRTALRSWLRLLCRAWSCAGCGLRGGARCLTHNRTFHLVAKHDLAEQINGRIRCAWRFVQLLEIALDRAGRAATPNAVNR